MNAELVLYDGMRLAIAKCAEIDEAAGIKNKAAQLEAYAQVRDDTESQRKFAEIRLRACIRIGELSRELETNERARTDLHPNDRNQTKEQTLKDAGIAVSTAHDYEQLTGGKEKQAQDIAVAAADSYFATAETNDEPLTMGGLKGAVRQALTKTFGEKTTREPPAKTEPDLLVHFLYSANWAANKGNFDPVALAQEVMEPFAQDEVDSCRLFLPLLQTFINEVEQRFQNVI
jgi:hypothetical protein